MAEPTPAFSLGREPRMDSVDGAVVVVSPAAMSSIPMTTGPQ